MDVVCVERIGLQTGWGLARVISFSSLTSLIYILYIYTHISKLYDLPNENVQPK